MFYVSWSLSISSVLIVGEKKIKLQLFLVSVKYTKSTVGTFYTLGCRDFPSCRLSRHSMLKTVGTFCVVDCHHIRCHELIHTIVVSFVPTFHDKKCVCPWTCMGVKEVSRHTYCLDIPRCEVCVCACV